VRRRKARRPATDKTARRPSADVSSGQLRYRDATNQPFRVDDGTVEAFDADGRSIGIYPNVQAAAAAIPERGDGA
jgi:hypothetical protein